MHIGSQLPQKKHVKTTAVYGYSIAVIKDKVTKIPENVAFNRKSSILQKRELDTFERSFTIFQR